jgi:cell shape-determining protein MreC
MGVGVSSLFKSSEAPTHYIDTLEMFQKDFAVYDKQKRQEEMQKRHKDLERRRIEQLERESRRWQLMEEYDRKLKSR